MLTGLTPASLATRLGTAGYLADDETATACFLALRMGRPLFLEGDPGVGKTALARAVAQALGRPLFRLQCYEGLSASEALYEWDFPRQLLHLRVAETAGIEHRDRMEAELYDRRFLLARPILRAFEAGPSVLLIDEIDRADDEFEAFLLEALSDFSVTVPELGTITAATPPFVLLTSNRTREVHDALKRRCLYHWLEHPSPERELAIIRQRLPHVPETLAGQVVAAARRMRQAGLLKPPGIAETLDWADALSVLERGELDAASIAMTLGSVAKYQEDQARLRKDAYALVLPRAEDVGTRKASR